MVGIVVALVILGVLIGACFYVIRKDVMRNQEPVKGAQLKLVQTTIEAKEKAELVVQEKKEEVKAVREMEHEKLTAEVLKRNKDWSDS